MERLNRVILVFCLLNTVIYMYLHTQQRLAPLSSPGPGKEKNQEDGMSRLSTQQRAALELQQEWTNPGHLPRTTTTLLYSTWRSGSSFLGGVFEASPQVMYIYEPFQDYGVNIIRYPNTVLVSG